MADNKQEEVQLKKAANLFLKAVKENASDKEFSELLAKNPKLLVSKEFTDKLFPNQMTKQKGFASLDKMMINISKVKELADKGIISSEQLETFMESSHSQTGETFATAAAQQAEAAKEKANHENPSFSEEGKNKLLDNLQNYEDCLEKMEELGVPMDLPNRAGKNAKDIYSKNAEDSKDFANALQVSIEDNSNEKGNLEIDGEALKVKVEEKPVEEKPVKVNVAEESNKKEEDEVDADVTKAPKDDSAKSGNSDVDLVKEQDIIDYMYNQWFLASVNWAIRKAVRWSDNKVDNLCEKFDKKCKENSKNKEEKQKNRVSEFQKGGQYLLTDGAKKLRDGYSVDKDKRLAMWKEVAANLGKDPQTWTVLNPKNDKTKQFICMINTEYKQDPQHCTNKVKGIIQNYDKNQDEETQLYALAVELAATEIAYEGMGSGRAKRGVQFQYNLGDLTAKEMDTKLKKRTIEKTKELLENLEKLQLFAELKAAQEGITDKEKIEKAKGDFIKVYLDTLSDKTINCQKKLLKDLNEENFSRAKTGVIKDLFNKGLSKDSIESYSAIKKLKNINNLGYSVLVKGHKDDIKDLRADAVERLTKSPLAKLNDEFNIKMQQDTTSQEEHNSRETKFRQLKEKILRGENSGKILNDKNNGLNKLWNESQGR